MQKTHYDNSYTVWHDSIEQFGAKLNLDKFNDHIRQSDHVLDFGCGSGEMLALIQCAKKYGVEINEGQRLKASAKGIQTVAYPEVLLSNSLDVIVSNHALEHVPEPYAALTSLYDKLKVGGKIIFCVPSEGVRNKYRPYVEGEKFNNYHLYTWSPENLGNLFDIVGFKVHTCKEYKHKWIPKYRFFHRILGLRIFNLLCQLYARISTKSGQTVIVAEK